MRLVRWLIFLAVAGCFFAIALNSDVYNLTSPPSLTIHVLLRKGYSIVAFTLVGATFVWALRPPRHVAIRTATVTVALFSALIEVGQKITDGSEPWVWNVVDVGCGAVGGWLAAVTISWTRVK